MKYCVIDFETASACDLKKAGAWVYSEHPTTEIICLAYIICEDGDDPMTGRPYQDDLGVVSADELYNKVEPFFSIAETDDFIIMAHNVSFEKSIWRNIMVPIFGWPDIPDHRWFDTMAVAAMKGLPQKLERLAAVLRLPTQKDTEGRTLTLGFSKLSKKGYYDRSLAKVARVMEYCGEDVKAELQVYRRIRGLGASERRVWLLDQTINERGIRLDMGFVAAAQRVCDDARKPLLAEFERVTNGLRPSQDDKFKRWLIENGCPFPPGEDGEPAINLQKETIAKLLGEQDDEESEAGDETADYSGSDEWQEQVPDGCRRALEIRSLVNSAAIKKLGSMRACCGSDGRAHWLLQYHGAGPGRWAGRLLQPQNFPRPTLKVQVGWNEDGTEKFEGHDPAALVAAIMSCDAEHVRLLYGDPIKAVANALRHTLIPNDGCLFEVGDFAQIEARIVLALAGQHDKTDAMAKGQSPYIPMAESIYKRKIDKYVDVPEYTIGKNTILGCGFGMGAKKFHARYCPKMPLAFAQSCIDTYRKVECPKVPKLWYALGDAATKCVWDRVPTEAYGIEYQIEDGFLTSRLPSGRKLWYYDPRAERMAMPWSTKEKPDIRPGFTYGAWKTGQWKRVKAYGGLLTENPVQALARDMLVKSLFNMEEDGHPVVLTVHDEGVTEVPDYMADAALMKQFMLAQDPWVKALGIPVDAECKVMRRYSK
jgi:DNA polymerase